MKALFLVALVGLAGCDVSALADKAVARTAEAVISPVVGPAATRCIVDNASTDELKAIAVDFGVEAGTTTEANILRIASRPAAAACLLQAGVTQVIR